MNVYKTNLFKTLLLILSVFSTQTVQAQADDTTQHSERDEAVAIIEKCRAGYNQEGCSNADAAVDDLINFYWRGDKALLTLLLDAGHRSDAGMSQTLGSFYNEMLLKRPCTFLRALALHPNDEQHRLAWMAAAVDGSGMPEESYNRVRATLQKLASQRRTDLANVAQLCLSEVEKFNRTTFNR